jgi:predicted nucleotidyltransferase
MILKNLIDYLKNELNENIFDIVIYGSSVKGKKNPNDLDILFIFLNNSLKERLEKIQIIKLDLIKKYNFNLDIKQILLKDLFSPSFLARTGIFLEGISIKNNNSFANTLGFNSYSLFTYDLSNLKHSEKVRFNYILAGRNKTGMIEELSGNRLVNGAIKIPIENSIIFEEILKTNKLNYTKKNILEEI